MLEHRAAGKLTAEWIGSEVIVQLPETKNQPSRAFTGGLSDFQLMQDGNVTLFMGGRLILVRPGTTVTRGTLNLPGGR